MAEATPDALGERLEAVLSAHAAKTQEGFASGVTDYLTKPFKAPFVRARVGAWLERVGGESS